jgi:DNA polymerase-1
VITLIDYSHIAWRNWHATKDPGEAYALIIEKMEFYTGDGAIVCCDGGKLKRKERFPDYKANRKEQPPEAHDTISAALEQVESWFVPLVKIEGHEADDVIATFCAQAFAHEVRIVSNDKDLFQLLAPNVRMETPKGTIDEDGCMRKFGVRPDQMRDWLALVGDASDNIPGCPQCGPGRARDLLREYGTIAGIREHQDEMTKVHKVGEKTAAAFAAWDEALAIDMVTLVDDLPIKLEDYL